MNRDGFTGIEVIVLCAVWALVGLTIGRFIEKDTAEQSAIKAGAAEYYLDKDHNKQFRWKTQQQ